MLVVTKADLGQTAIRAESDLRAALRSLGARTEVLAVSSLAPGTGIEALVDSLDEHRAELDLAARRLHSRRAHALADFLAEHGERGPARSGRPSRGGALARRTEPGHRRGQPGTWT